MTRLNLAKRACILAGALLLSTVMVASTAYAQTKGQLTVGGKVIPLANVYAYFDKGFFDESKNDTVVVLADGPLTDALARDRSALTRLSGQGKLHFVQVTISAKGQIINYLVGHDAFKLAPSGGSTEHKFEAKVMDAKTISGTVFTAGPQSAPFGGPSYEYKVEFSAPVQPRR